MSQNFDRENSSEKPHIADTLPVKARKGGDLFPFNEVFYRTLFEAANDSIFILENYRFIECNHMTLRMFGCKDKSDILGLCPWDFSPPAQPDGSPSKEKAMTFMDAALNGKPQRFFWKHRQKGGREFDTEISLNNLKIAEKNVLQAIVRDISESTRAEQALKESEERFRTLVEQSPFGISLIGADGRYHYINPRFHKMFGYTLQDVSTGRAWFTKAFPEKDYRDKVLKTWLDDRRQYGKGQSRPRFFTVTCKDGSRKVIHFIPVTMENLDQFILYEDVTDRRKAEEKLNRYKHIVSSSSDHLAMLDKNYVYQMVNDAYLKAQNKRLDDIVGHSVPELFGQEFFEHIQKPNIDRCLKGDTVQYQLWVNFPSTGKRFMEVFHYPYFEEDGSVSGYVVNARDVTDRKRAEEALRRSEEKYRELVENLNDVIFTIGIDGTITFVSPPVKSILGYSPDELIGKNYLQLAHSDDLPLIQRDFENAIQGQSYPSEFRVRAKSGDFHWLRTSTIPVFNKETIVGIQGVLTDITDRKKAETALIESEERYRSLVENTLDGYFICEIPSGKFIFLNQRICDLFQYDMQEGLKQTVWGITDPSDHKKIQERFQSRIEGKLLGFVANIYNTIRKDGSKFKAEVSTSLVSYHGKSVIQGTLRDITEREKLQTQLQQAQKMEAIGTLAGGIAHDFNNILTPFIAHTELAILDLPEGHSVQNNLKEALKASYRARELVKQILAFSQQKKTKIIPLNVGPVINEALKLLRASIPTTVDIKTKLDARSDRILADPTHIHQIIMNLCTNAAQAMSESGGTLEVKIDNQYLAPDDKTDLIELESGEYLRLSISDTGHGMNPSILKRIFDPYFTTKDKQHGTGLGLAVVHGIVKTLRGEITVTSEPGRGSVFGVYLPLAADQNTGAAESGSDKNLPAGTEHIMVVDDDKMVVDSLRSILTHLGYRVTIKNNSIEALSEFRNKPEDFDLIITDQTMPDMTGRELAAAILALRQNIPIVLCTGYSEQINKDTAEALGIGAFVMKPFMMNEIALTLRRLLDRKEPTA